MEINAKITSRWLGVTHLLLFSRTETGANLRIARTPRGPTLHFKIHSYSLSKNVKNHQKAPKESVNDLFESSSGISSQNQLDVYS
jgi:ribosome biogenesis protein SSF1/2